VISTHPIIRLITSSTQITNHIHHSSRKRENIWRTTLSWQKERSHFELVNSMFIVFLSSPNVVFVQYNLGYMGERSLGVIFSMTPDRWPVSDTSQGPNARIHQTYVQNDVMQLGTWATEAHLTLEVALYPMLHCPNSIWVEFTLFSLQFTKHATNSYLFSEHMFVSFRHTLPIPDWC
jgi:hypothetical protein